MNLKKIKDAGIEIFGDEKWRGDCPKEIAEQIGFFSLLRQELPEIAEIAVHIRNEGKKPKFVGAQHKVEGMVTGASDIIIPGCPSLLIELKQRDHTKSKISNDQIKYLVRSKKRGSMACVAIGTAGAMEAVMAWLELCQSTTTHTTRHT